MERPPLFLWLPDEGIWANETPACGILKARRPPVGMLQAVCNRVTNSV